MRFRNLTWAVGVVAIAAAAAAHPHFNKTISVTLPSGVEAKLTYNTTPANEARAESAAVGAFVTPRGPRLELSGEVSTGSGTIAAGEYTIGVIKGEDGQWTMALSPGRLGRGEQPDMSKVIKLESVYRDDAGVAEHMLIDITPGAGSLEGKAVITLHFGSMFLAGVLSA
jgi:hypothetical protein